MSNAQALAEEMKAHLKAARDLSDAVDKDGRDFNDAERAQVTELVKKAQDAKARLEQAKGDAAVRSAIADLGDGIGMNEKAEKISPAGLIVPDGRKTVAQHYLESAEYQELLASAPGGVFQKNHRVQSRPVGYEQLLAPRGGQKALVTGLSDTSGGALVQNDWRGLQVGLDAFQRPLTLRDLVTSGSTTSDTVEYARIASVTNSAAPVAEATSSAGPTVVSGTLTYNTGGGYKPESGLTTVKVTTPVRTIAHWIPITKRALSDAAQMATLIDNFLGYGLEEELEDQMISGDGSGENLEGLSNVSGIQAQAYDAGGLLATLRKAKTKVRTVGRSIPNGYVINPADLEAVDLLVDNENRYYFGGPAAAGSAPTLWGLPIVESEAVAAGTAYVGDFRKAVLWDRQQATITTTDSHADYFVRNLVAILAELRAAFGVLQPNAFVEIDLTEGA